MSPELIPQRIQPKVHELSMIKQVLESRSHSLEIIREALSNMCAPEVGAQEVKIQFFLHPDYGGTFIFRDDGCGMDYSDDVSDPGRLNRFLNLGYSGAAGISVDKYGWKGLGSKLMLNCKRLEIITWNGLPNSPVYKVEIENPRSKLLQDIPEWPQYYLTKRDLIEHTDKKGTTITMYGVEGGNVSYQFEDLKRYLYWNTIVGITKNEPGMPEVFLKVNLHEEKLPIGYRWIRQRDPGGPSSWRTVLTEQSITATDRASTGEEVTVVLKGGFTLDTADAFAPGEGLSPARGNVGLRLSVLGIPYFRLTFYRLKGERFQMYESLCSFVVECDQLNTKLNIDRSGYNRDDPIAKAFEKAVTKAFDHLAMSESYKTYNEKRHHEDEVTKGKFLNDRKKALGKPDQNYVCINNSSPNQIRILHRVPENEQDTLALFWKLEGAHILPFAHFVSLEHTAKSGIDIIADYQIEDDGQLHIAEAIEFEYIYENFLAHAHSAKQTSLVICWKIRNPANLQVIKPWISRAQIGDHVINVVELQKLDCISINPGAELR
ncbi:MAG: hypothetical protein PHU23_03160 [Dehalococcoidales bacterium]|nr:hypothetical protein [Dehalococcoidales bacterium]